MPWLFQISSNIEPCSHNFFGMMLQYRADSRFAPNQWETVLLCNDVSHWLGAGLESALQWETVTVKKSMDSFNLSGVSYLRTNFPDSKVHGANMGPTWVLSALDGPHVGPMNLAIRVGSPPPWPICYLSLRKVCYMCNIFSHWQKLCLVADR